VLDEHERELVAQQCEEGALLVAARERLDRILGTPLDAVLRDAALGQAPGRALVIEEALTALGQRKVLRQTHPGDQGLLEPRGGQVGDARTLVCVVGLAGHVRLVQAVRALDGAREASA
jgi:hypothetical protein